jgi:hypothetical protein
MSLELEMQTKLFSAALASCVLLAAAPAGAQAFRGAAKLAVPASSPSTATVGEATWRCEGELCIGTAERRAGLDSQMKECRKVAQAVGPLIAYSSRGRPMSDRNVATCNKLAGQAKPANELAAK